MPPKVTKILAAVVLGLTYLEHHMQWIPPGYKWHGIDVQGVVSTLVTAFAALGISGPALSAKLASALGNPPAPMVTK